MARIRSTERQPEGDGTGPAAEPAGRGGTASETGGRADYAPTGTDANPSMFGTLKRTIKEFSEDNVTDWAAALTYYGLLAIFPAIIALVSLLGLFGDPATTTRALTDIVSQLAPGTAAETLRGPIESITSRRSAAGVAFVLGLLGALYSASKYVAAFTRAANVMYETPEGRKIWKLKPLQLLITLVMIVLAAVIALSLVLTGPVVEAVAQPLGIGSIAVTLWDITKWPVLVLLALLMIGVLYYFTPNVKVRSSKFVSAGALLALTVWLVASALFAFYVANFGSYNKTYGALAGIIVLLVWSWITNVALLLGVELNAERERSQELKDGVPRADREIQLEPRGEPKDQATT
jgi:membrane protein